MTSLLPFGVALLTAVAVAALLWAQRQRWLERRRRQNGSYTLAIDHSYHVFGCCLGVIGYFGLLFLCVWTTFDLLEDRGAPEWLAFVVAFGILGGFFLFVWWSTYGVGESFAAERLIIDPDGLRLVKINKTDMEIRWHEPWTLEQFAHLEEVRHRRERWTEYKLLLRLTQGDEKVVLQFESGGGRVGGLPEFKGDLAETKEIAEMGDWLEGEILHRANLANTVQNGEPSLEEAKRRVPDPPEPALMQALNFTEEDLSANRDGAFTGHQVADIKLNLQLMMGTFIVLAILFSGLILGTLYLVAQGEPLEGALPFVIVFALTAGFCALMATTTYADLSAEMTVIRVDGLITLQFYPHSSEFWLRVQELGFPLSESTYKALSDQQYYRLFYLQHGAGGSDKTLLSAVSLSGT